MAEIAYRQAELELFLQEVFGPELKQPDDLHPALPVEPLDLDDEEILTRAGNADNGAKFSRLRAGDWKGDYSSQSEADLALCGMLAFWTGRDRERMNRLFRRSGLYRKKWDRAGYSSKTLENAIVQCKEVYKPRTSKPEQSSSEYPETRWPEGYSESPPDSEQMDCEPEPHQVDETGFTPEELLEAAYSGQDGDAELFVRIHKGRLCYDHAAGRWFIFEGHSWQEDFLNEALAAVDDVTELYVKEAKRLSWACITATKAGRMEEAGKADKDSKVFLKKISCLQKVQWKQSVLQLAAAGKDSLGITGDEWDREPWLLPCKNGVVNLRDGTSRPGRPEDYFKTVCPHEWKGLDEPARIWDSFQIDITNDKDIPDFNRRIFGSDLPEVVIERTFPILVGPNGQNGKGTYLEAIGHTLGRLAGPIPAEMLLKQRDSKNPDAPSPSVMSLRGKRIVWASETERGRRFDTQKVKWLTGADTLVGRAPFGRRQVEFTPSHSVLLLTNDLPRVSASEHAFWERAFLIRFPFTFKENPSQPNEKKRDAYLLEKLQSEASGILAWLVRGCLEWQQQGLSPPKTVLASTEQYRRGEDQIARFIEDRCIVGPGMEVKSSALSKAYRAWCEENGDDALKGRDYTDEMGKKYDSYHKNTGTHYIGLGLLDVPASTESDKSDRTKSQRK